MLIVANWKAYVDDFAKAKKLFALAKRLSSSHASIVLAPPAPLLGALAAGNKSKVAFAAQDVSRASGGAHTGEVSARSYATVGATYAIVGHSERRTAGDTDTIVAEKLAMALTHGLTPILCIGETERDGEGKYLSVVREELTLALTPLTHKERTKVIIAYEPLWAIGKTASAAIGPNDLSEMVLYIHKVLAELLPGKNSARALVLYGGSVEPDNAKALIENSGINGFLVGHASVEPDAFSLLAKQLVR
ncbi:MAG: triose-phosphate isomerase [Candidatus Pacebacteria bacterium]|nr:triose-phosphate isomerase [Candidatus Paceibacterota bacterium]